MSVGEVAPVFVAWEEQVICQERGNRVIHFYLKDASGNSVLAVVGTERSVRHMMYVVHDHFLQAYGSTQPINACKWRARREVVDWLTCLVSRNRPHIDGVQLDDSEQGVESLKMLTAGINACKKSLPDKMISRKLKFQSSDIEWSGIGWFCAKQLKHYSGFCRNGTTVNVHSFVYIMAEEENHYLGYLEDMYEDKKRQKKVKIRWFHQGQEVKHAIPQLNLQEGEVFITPHVQVISAECVNGPATVLTPKHYEKYLAGLPHGPLSEIHMCFRQFKDNKLKPFKLSKLRGYSNQSVLSCLSSPILSKRKAKCLQDDENFTEDDSLRSSNKRNRNSRGYQVLEKGSSGLQNSALINEMTTCEPKYPSLKLKLSRRTMGINVIGPKPQLSFKVNEKIEVLCQDSGLRGCWFRCKILTMSQRQLKVQYEDVLDVDGPEKLEEWVLASRVADPDKLGMRCSGRLTVRPCAPEFTTDHSFEIGAPVDAWWCDGWWEGVITAINVRGVGIQQVYLPGEDKFLMVEKNNIRISQDWIGNRWVDIPGKPNICSYISLNVSSSIRLSANSAMVDGSMSDCGAILESKSSSIPKVEVAQKVEPELSCLEAPDDLESMKRITLRKPLHAIHEEDKDNNTGGGSVGDSDNDDVYDDRKSLHAFDEDKDNSFGGGNGSGGDTNNDNDDDDADNTEGDSEENLMMEGNFDYSEPKLDAAEAIQVT
ncbi:uncharacterized protein LOC133290289 [Gastrolobium bilobum]|uniref:uncharacterized protein LOC133290289 n=1 Tax=Gastrolobium bilobum TaxID=150636 RepID=UPI002AB2F15C|nr:uncharacterized protein LOC133290289 [Gastrolobium bilobum]